jgi:hypothetical protein
MILFDDNVPVGIKRFLRSPQEFNRVLITEMRKHPLNPHTVVSLAKLKLLQSNRVVMSHVLLLFQDFLRLVYQLFTLVDQIDLNHSQGTFLKVWQSNYLEIRPIPAPQSNTESLLNLGFSLTIVRIKERENLISIPLRLA